MDLKLEPVREQRLKHRHHLFAVGIACSPRFDVESIRFQPTGSAGKLIVLQAVCLTDQIDQGDIGRAKKAAGRDAEVDAPPRRRVDRFDRGDLECGLGERGAAGENREKHSNHTVEC
jgi:hypothetical protein